MKYAKKILFVTIRAPLIYTVIFLPSTFAENINYSHYGPLRVHAQSPTHAGSLTPLLRSGFALPEGKKEVYGSATVASVWAETDDYYADYYHNSLNGGIKWQLTEKWMFDTNYKWSFSGDNHLDSVTIWFHDAFGVGQNGRDNTIKDKNQIFSKNGINQPDLSGDTLTNALNFYLEYQLLSEDNYGLSIGGSLYYNHVNSGPFVDNRFEQALQLNYSYTTGMHHFYSTTGISFRRNDESLSGIDYKDHAVMLSLGYEYLMERHGWLIELHHYEGLLKTDNDFSKPSHEVFLGYRYYLNNSAIEFTIVENLLNMDNSTDIAFSLGYRVMI